MSAPAFTPGPWHYSHDPSSGDFYLMGGPEGDASSTFLEGGLVLEYDLANQANANLIAAAPALYSALADIAFQLSSIEGRTKGDTYRLLDQVAKAQAALELARGHSLPEPPEAGEGM